MSQATFKFVVTQEIEVKLDPSKFDATFMEEFRQSFFRFDTLDEHAEHIAQLQARGVIDVERTPEFIEGYGRSDEMGISASVASFDVDQVLQP